MSQISDRTFGAKPGVPRKPAGNLVKTAQRKRRYFLKQLLIPMDTMTRILMTAALLSLCAFIRSAVGFGDALLAIPFLGLIMSLSTASPVVALAGLVMSLSILVANQEMVDFPSAWRLIVASLIG